MRHIALAFVIALSACSGPLTHTEPHLIVSQTHQDLGKWIKGATAYNEGLQGTVDYVNAPKVFYQGAALDCALGLSVIDQDAFDPDLDFYVDGRGRVMVPRYRYKQLQTDDAFDSQALLDPGLELSTCFATPTRTVSGFYYYFATDKVGHIAKLSTYHQDELEVVDLTVP